MIEIYNEVCYKSSKIVTTKYSTSFSIGILLLDKSIRKHIYSIYGFVRLADEIVDTFHDTDQKYLLQKFEKDTYEAINTGISLNPVLHSFQMTVNEYKIDHSHIDAFLNSMKMDLLDIKYNDNKFEEYIFGSAQVVGLMCLQVYTQGNKNEYEKLKNSAISLGSAFQKINFLRDLKNDIDELGRSYFPNLNFKEFDEKTKKEIEKNIEKDFEDSLEGIKKLPKNSQMGVYTAYLYYKVLLKKIKKLPAKRIMNSRVRVSNINKFVLMIIAKFRIIINRM
ncbi:MAG: phytoene/squalene synthase family protein [Chlorobiota bacterium]